MLVARRKTSLRCEGGTDGGTIRACFSALESFFISSKRNRPDGSQCNISSTALCFF
jgi:hypothetical protein